jgi:hypothetical protein
VLASMKGLILIALAEHHLARGAKARLVGRVLNGGGKDLLCAAGPATLSAHPANSLTRPAAAASALALLSTGHSTLDIELI